MSKFLTGPALNDSIFRIIWEAKSTLMLVSPFIRLDKHFRDLLLRHEKEPRLHIKVVFGKNEDRLNKSLSKDDFEFLTQFPNISIIYVPNLHGKYYGNENAGVLTSINLHDHSFENNIEFGVYAEASILPKIQSSTNNEAWNYCIQITELGIPVFIKRPSYQKSFLSALLGKNYVRSEVLLDNIKMLENFGLSKMVTNRNLLEFPEELEFKAPKVAMPQKEMPLKTKNYKSSIINKDNSTGYCIRTGIIIPRNPEKPFCYEAFKEWSEYSNLNYHEKFCHFTGEKSYGKTSYQRPILNDNYRNKNQYTGNIVRWT